MKTHLLTITVLLAAAPAALAWPFARQNGNFLGEPAAQNSGRLLQLDNDASLEYYGGGMSYTQITVNAAGTTSTSIVALPSPTPIAGDFNTYYFLGRGDTGDLDGDGDTDIVYSCQANFSNAFPGGIPTEDYSAYMRIVVCRNDGSGGFTNVWQTKEGSSTSLGAPDIKLADMDRDGDLDMVETHGGVRIRWNQGNGVFNGSATSVRSTAVAYSPMVEVSDFDGNGWLDVAVIVNTNGWKGGRLELYSQDAGTFTGSTVHSLPADHWYDESLLADVDGDGRMDVLASGNDTSTTLYWHRNTGSGFAAPVSLWSASGFGVLQAFQAGDVDEDGTPDVLFAIHGNELRWRRGLGGNSFAPESDLISIPIFGSPSLSLYTQIGLGDLDGDGKPDLLFDSGFHRNVTPPNKLSASVTQWSGAALSGTVDLTTGDLNNDGRMDLIASDGGGNFIRWYTPGSNGLTAQLSLSTGNSYPPTSVAAGDWNGDGWTDLAWSAPGQLRQAISTFGTGIGWNVSAAVTVTGVASILPYNMDGDGDTDILANFTDGGVRIFANFANAGSTFWTTQTVATGLTGVSRIAAGQMIPGGRPEVAALTLAGGNPPGVTTFRHNGAWSQMDTHVGSFSSASYALIMADMDTAQPGLETVFSHGSNELFYDYEFNSSFNPPRMFGLSAPVVQIAAVDWDKNGFTDILVAAGHGITLFSYQGSVVTPVSFFQGTNAVNFQDLQVLDINDDGFPDAVAADTTGELHLITNTSAQVEVTTFSRGPTGLVAGGAAEAVLVRATRGTSPRFAAPITPATVRMRFRRSVFNGTTDTPGTALTQAEVQPLVDNIYLEEGARRSTPVAPVVAADGTFTMILDATSRQAFSGTGGYSLRVRLRSTAASAFVQRFYVELSPASEWVSLNDSGNSSPGGLRTSGDTDIAYGLFYVRPVGPLDTWRLNNFGSYDVTSLSANNADPDGDGNSNLVEYVMSQNPNVAGGIGSTSPIGLTYQGQESPFLADLRLLTTYDSRVRLTIQKSTTLQAWTTMSTRTGTAAWTGTVPSSSSLSGGRTRFSFNTNASPDTTLKFYLRLKAEELP